MILAAIWAGKNQSIKLLLSPYPWSWRCENTKMNCVLESQIVIASHLTTYELLIV